MTQIPMKGGPELLAFLAAFPKRMQKGAVRASMTAAAKPIRDQARLNAPKASGKMAKSIKTGSASVYPDGTVRISVRMKGEHAFLGIFHEYGVAPHYITGEDDGLSARLATRRDKRNAIVIEGNVVSGAIGHPGHMATPFMRPALDMRAEDAVNAFGERLKKYLSDKASFTSPTFEVEEAA